MSQHQVSVIIPVKDDVEALKKAVYSITLQDHGLISEIIVVENGSRKVSNIDSHGIRLELIHLENPNRSTARNYGAKKANGKFLLFMDADVVLSEGWLSSMLKYWTSETLAIQSSIVPASPEFSLLQKMRKSRAFFYTNLTFLSLNKSNSRQVVLNSACFIISREAFFDAGMFDPFLHRHEDLDFTKRLLLMEGLVKGIQKHKCFVYFNGNLFEYLIREFACGYHIVRFHEKWSSPKFFDSVRSLFSLIFCLPGKFKKSEWFFWVLDAIFLFGSFFGIFRKMFDPYPGKIHRYLEQRAKIEII